MELIAFDSLFKEIGVVDKFKSLLWTDRYWSSGDFEIVLPPTSSIWSLMETTAYFKLKESDHVMVPEIINIHSDPEEGNELVIKGRSLEGKILDKRIVWDITELDGNLQTTIQSLLNDSFINPVNTYRDVSNFVFSTSTDPAITGLTLATQFFGETIYKVMSDVCKSKNIGFKIVLSDTTPVNFLFSLYAGVDRSNNQTSRPSVVFSFDFDNLVNGDYVKSDQMLRTCALIAGEKGVANYRITTVVHDADGPTKSGLARSELFVDASNISSNTPDGQLSRADYLELLVGRGYEELAKNRILEGFDGQVDTTQFNYGDEYFMGDIVQLEDDYGHSTASRVTELIHFQDPAGIKIYPTFEAIIE